MPGNQDKKAIVVVEADGNEAVELKLQRWDKYVRFWAGKVAGALGVGVSVVGVLGPELLEVPAELLFPIFAASATLLLGRNLAKNLIDYGIYLRAQENRGEEG